MWLMESGGVGGLCVQGIQAVVREPLAKKVIWSVDSYAQVVNIAE